MDDPVLGDDARRLVAAGGAYHPKAIAGTNDRTAGV